jgi:hypothetical protein
MTEIDPEDHRTIGKTFNIADPLSREIMWVNDDAYYYVESPESRWCRVRAWVSMHILQSAEPKESGHDQK